MSKLIFMADGIVSRILYLMKRDRIKNPHSFSKSVGINYKTVNYWFKRDGRPNEEHINKISLYFNVSPSWLRYGEEKFKPTLTNRVEGFAKKLENYPELFEQIFSIAEALIPQYEKRRIEKVGKDTSVQKKKYRKKIIGRKE